MQRCATYTISLTNNLDEKTNLHTHGLHVSGEKPGDNVIDVEVEVGQTHTYTYYIPCTHSTGTLFYHPHGHGTTAGQISAGLAGALIVEDAANKEAVPEWLTKMRSFVFLAQKLGSSYRVNGVDAAQASIAMQRNEWVRLRIVHSAEAKTTEFSLPNGCEAQLLAKDGVFLPTVPRAVGSLFVGTMVSRADVAVKCTSAGIFAIGTVGATLTVSDGAGEATPLAPFTPCRPPYLADLQETTPDVMVDIAMGAANLKVNGVSYKWNGNPADPEAVISNLVREGQVAEATLGGTQAHPLHTHVNHMQLQSLNGLDQDVSGSWHQLGDWLDTIKGGKGLKVRFIAKDFGGKMVMHCHISGHSDGGAFAWLDLGEGGNDGSSLPPTSCSGSSSWCSCA